MSRKALRKSAFGGAPSLLKADRGPGREALNLGIVLSLVFLALPLVAQRVPINRQALVERHKVVVTSTDSLSSLSPGGPPTPLYRETAACSRP
jgi:hypothetical protein